MLASIATVSYVTAAAAYFFLSVLLLTSWRGRLHRIALTIACLLSVLWAASISYQVSSYGQPISLLTDILEILRNASWMFFLVVLLGPFRQISHSFSRQLKPTVVYGIAVFLVLSFISL